MTNLNQQLSSFLKADQIRTKLLDRHAYASDAGCYSLLPRAVVVPGNENEIRELFALSRRENIPLVFRAGGTSLSGQSITDGILADLSIHWKKVEVLEEGRQVLFQPGVTGHIVNRRLASGKAKIGPDPASIVAAQMGGILSNNASGMCCGVALNAYHTLAHLRFMLPSGNVFDSRLPEDYDRFEKEEPGLFRAISEARDAIAADEALRNRIARKYQTKNTVGYSLNAFIDFFHPLDIFTHLLVGAEGTLAFISEGVLNTIPDKPLKTAALLFFRSPAEACAVIPQLVNSGAEALELMDRASLRSVEDLPSMPPFMKFLPVSAAALLVEYQHHTREGLEALMSGAGQLIATFPLLQPAAFTQNEADRLALWKVRKGLFPSVGSMRRRGTSVILEDIAFPIDKLADAVTDLQKLFGDFGYEDAIIFGHAKDGNLHFVITQHLDSDLEIKRYDAFLKAMVNLVIDKYDGALKAEHGTGRNMAPFVQKEWGAEAYAIMEKLKKAADPHNILNPGVVLNPDPNAHVQHIKPLPVVEQEVDKCIECGFCEPACPSRRFTMTPRRRIVARRAMALAGAQGRDNDLKQLKSEYEFDGLDTCATDGLCAVECPVSINTGELVKRLRRENHSKTANKIANRLARNFGSVESQARGLLGFGAGVNHFAQTNWLTHLTELMHKGWNGMPVFQKYVASARFFKDNNPPNPAIVYFPSCINRILEPYPRPAKPLPEVILELSRRAGVEVLLPPGVQGNCCGQIFSSKGFNEAARIALAHTVHNLWIWTRKGRLPVVCDFSSCTYTFLKNGYLLEGHALEQYTKIKFIDSVEYLAGWVTPKLKIRRSEEDVLLHPACSVIKLNLGPEMIAMAKACTDKVEVPPYLGCCGMAGDRGFLVPELPKSATQPEFSHLDKNRKIQGYCSSTTCEMNLTLNSGYPFDHIARLLLKHSAPAQQ